MQDVSEAWEQAGQREGQHEGQHEEQGLSSCRGKLALRETGSWDIGFQALATVGAASGCPRQQGVFRKLQVVQN